jgi:DNA-binding Lrp family transcriptional regulator
LIIHFTLLQIYPTYEHEVWNALYNNKQIIEMYSLFGEWDLIIKWTADINYNQYDIARFIDKVIYVIPGIKKSKTITMPSV